MRIVTVFLLFSSFLALHAGQSPQQTPQAENSPSAHNHAFTADDVAELRRDIELMKANVHQMQTNLAFVDTTQSPLKHQFQLEIDMWNLLIADMERRLPSSSR